MLCAKCNLHERFHYRTICRLCMLEIARIWRATPAGKACKQSWRNRNRDKEAAYQKKHFLTAHGKLQRHNHHVKERSIRIARNTAIILDRKKSGCTKCGEMDLCCLEFHHIIQKEWSIADMRKSSLNDLQSELSKCVVLCLNCHRKEHHRLRLEAKNKL